MGDFADYCGSLDVRYYCQTQYDQLTEYGDVATFNNWIAGTLIPQAEKVIDRYIGHHCGTPSYGTLNLDGSGKQVVWLPAKYTPFIGASGGSIDSVGITMSDLRYYDQHIARNAGNFPTGFQNVTLNGSWGYLDGNRLPIVPEDIQYICSQLCANVILDLVRRNVAPEIFRQIMVTRTMEGERGMGSLWASPFVLTEELRQMLNEHKIKWVDIV